MWTFAGQTVSALELAAFVTGLLSVWLTQRMHVANWPFGLVNVVCFSVLFVEAKLYADALLQVAFFVLGAYGWWTWARAKQAAQALRVTRSSLRELLVLAALGAVGTIGVAQFLVAWTDSPAPWPDAAVLVLSLIATWAQAKCRLESWWIWIAVDVVSIPLYWSRALPLTALLFAVFLCICVAGLASWRARLLQQEALP